MYLLTEDIGLKKKKNCVNLELGAARLLSRQSQFAEGASSSFIELSGRVLLTDCVFRGPSHSAQWDWTSWDPCIDSTS